MDAQAAAVGVDSSGSVATEVGPVLKIEVVEEVLTMLAGPQKLALAPS